ncbi:ABC transporter permease [Streptomyces sp. ID05-26A]|nr:ABC transporter permease [Streptomyces sp. ID05-26A]
MTCTDGIFGKHRIEQGVLLSSISVTLQETLVGFVIGAALGLVVGFVLGTSRTLSDILSPILAALYAIPRLALIPLFMLWFGLGFGSKLALVITVVFFLVFYNTHSGVRDVDQELVGVLKVMKASRWQVHTKVTIPSAMTWIIAGLHVSVPYALVAAVTGEMVASNRGMGYLIIRASGQFNTAGVFGGIAVLMALALVLTAVVHWLERKLLSWKSEKTAGGTGW